MIIRLTQKLATKIKAGKLPEMPLDANEYADWSAHVFVGARLQRIILCNTKSFYACLMFAKGITNTANFVERGLITIQEFMETDGNGSIYRQHIAPSNESVSFAKALNRTVTGTMNDHIQGAKLYLEDGITPYETGVRLNETPLSALLDETGRKYSRPKRSLPLLSNNLAGS